jgi:steroid delta-isomerase-like uncharacterized protein
MSERDHVRIIQDLFENLNARRLDASDAYIAEDYRATAPGWPGPFNRDQVKDTFRTNFVAFPDLKYELQDIIAQGDKAAATWEMTGTHQNELITASGQRLPPTGRNIRLRVSTVYDFKDGKLIYQESFFDLVTFLTQLGLMAPAGQTS